MKPNIEPAHKFEVSLEADTFTEEKFALFSNYQSHVHHDPPTEISRSGFRRFLCSSPIHNHPSTDNTSGLTDDPTGGPTQSSSNKRLGSFHQTYRLDGRLIAMSVLDLLPHAVSGVYFIYHSDFEKYSFGKLSALRETALAAEEGYEMYYMGYFIASCKKMRYKADYRPQHVLDYDTGEWDTLDDEMKSLMEKRKWVSMSRERNIRQQLSDLLEPKGPVSPDSRSELEEELVLDAYAVPYRSPVEAMHSRLSVLSLNFPGALTLEQLAEQIALDEMKVTLGQGTTHRMRDIVSWAQGSVTDPQGSLMGVMAELAACVGKEVAGGMVVDLGRL